MSSQCDEKSANEIVRLRNPQGYRKLITLNQKVILKFTATWCGPCNIIAPKYRKLAEEQRSEKIVFAEVDVDEFGDSDEGERILKNLQVSSIPAFVTFLNGQKEAKMVGASTEHLTDLVRSLSKKEG